MTTGALPELFSREMLLDPYPVYASLRRESAVARNPRPSLLTGDWLLTRFADVYPALADHETFSSDPQYASDGRGTDDPILDLLRTDPPLHSKLRSLLNAAFTPRRIRTLEPRVEEIVGSLLDAAGGGEIDAMEALCVPLPLTVIAELLGIQRERHADFKRWSDARVSTVMPRAERDAAMTEMFAFFQEAAAERRAEPREDLITTLVQGGVDGEPLSDRQVQAFCSRLLVAGNETTTNLIGNMLHALAARPDVWDALSADRALVPAAVEETLRFDTPVHVLIRYTTRDVAVAGTRIPAGERVGILFASANHDEAEFPEPHEFRLDRELSRHVAFGAGIHYCLGAPLARLEAVTALNALLDRYTLLRPGAAPAELQTESATLRGFRRLPLHLS